MADWLVVAVGLVLLALPAVFATLAVRSYTNRLVFYPEWVSTKTTLEFTPMMAAEFVELRQALAGNRVDLGAWHGFQEIVYEPERAGTELRLRFQIAEGGYLAIFFTDRGASRLGLLVSRHPALPSQWIEADDTGKFLETWALPHAPLSADWYNASLHITDDVIRVAFAGETHSLLHPDAALNLVAFRGSMAPVAVDAVSLRFAGGARYTQGFSRSHHAWTSAAGPAVIWAAFLLLAGGVIVWRTRRPRLAFYSLVLAGFCGTVLTAAGWLWMVRTAPLYPAQGERLATREWILEKADRSEAEILARFDATADQPHILVMGTSQTWGEGAANAEERFVAQLESMLRARHPETSVVCLPMGFCGGESPLLMERFRQNWAGRREPEIVLVNAATNDLDAVLFRENLRWIAEYCRERDIPLAYIAEPNAPEKNPGGHPNLANVREVARAENVPVFELHDYLESRYDTGFLWWDFVHPTSYGHHLIGEFLATALEEHGMIAALRQPSD